jgi:hypothetical protein
MKTYYFEIKGLTKETQEQIINFVKSINEDLIYDTGDEL